MTKQREQQLDQKKKELEQLLCQVDPYISVDNKYIDKLMETEKKNEHYDMQSLKIDNLNEESFSKLVEQRKKRIMLEEDKKEKE